MSNPFEYIKIISDKNRVPDDAEVKLNYVPFLTNRNFSYTMDTALIANEMNKYPDCEKLLQFKYFFNSVKKRKRYAKWTKPPKPKNDYLIIKKYFNYNDKNTELAMKLLTKEQIKVIKSKMNIGGAKKTGYDI